MVLSEPPEGGTDLVRRPRAVALQHTCRESLAARSTLLIEGGMAGHPNVCKYRTLTLSLLMRTQ